MRGFSHKDLSLILGKVHKTVAGRFHVLINQTIEELLPKQQGRPLELSEADLKKLVVRHGVVVRVAAGKLVTELCDAASGRETLTERRLNQIREVVQPYIEVLTSARSAEDLLATAVLPYFTVARLKKVERRLTKLMSRTGFRRLLAKDAEQQLAYIHAKFGIRPEAVPGGRFIRVPLPAKQHDLSRHFDGVKLTDRQREIMSLRLEHGLPFAQIARRLGLHRRTVDEHYQRGQNKLNAARGADSRARVRAKTKPGNLD